MYVCTYIYSLSFSLSIYAHACHTPQAAGDPRRPLHDITIANIVWCMAYTRKVRLGSCVAQSPCNSIATVWAMQAGRKIEKTIDSCTND